MTWTVFYVLMALAAGACLPTQAGINARLTLWTQSPVTAAAISFAVGTLALVVYAAVLRIAMPDPSTAIRQPGWVWSGGVLGAFFVASMIVLAARLGAAPMVALVVCGQLITSVVLDHFGWLGYPEHAVSPGRILGIALMVAGIILIKRF
jgi:transporter family-2 protein